MEPRFYLVMRHCRDNSSHHEKTYTGPMHGWQYPYMEGRRPHSCHHWNSEPRRGDLVTNPHWKKWPMPESKALAMRDELLACESLKSWNVWAIEFEERR